MQFRYLLSPNQPHYRVNGHEVALIMRQSPTLEISSDISLQLKLEKGENASAKNTPSINEDSDGISTSRTHNEKPLIRSSPSDVIQFTPSEHTQDALDDAITEARTVEGLVCLVSPLNGRTLMTFQPLDLDEEEHHHDGVFLDEAEDGQSEDEKNPKSKTKSKKGSFARSWQGNFSCMSKHDGAGKSEYPNARTIEVLQQMADYYDRTQDHWRLNAYRKAITALRKQDHKITTEEEAFAVPFIGQRLAAKIEEIVWTDKLRRLENTALEPNDEVLQTFLKIYGVGLKQATKWIDQGYRSIEDLQKAQLTKNQKIGIEHYEDFQLRIPRGEMRRHDQYVREICSKIDARIQFTIGGSYRRGAANSGDIDFIVNMPDCTLNTLRTLMFGTVIPQLETLGYLKVSLATSSKDEGSKWHGAAALPGCSIWRRIDLLFVPWEEMGAALIYFTGNDIFNRSIRLLASRKGMRLNQHGLWKDVIRGKNRERVTQGSLVEGKDEKKIFEVLGVPWRPPEHRIC